MAKKTGRKSAYDTKIAPRLEDIKEWRKVGATVENVCTMLDISESTFYKYLEEKTELSDAYKRGTTELVIDLRGELARQAFPHTLETKKMYKKKDMETGHETVNTEITKKEVDGNIAAINLLLKNIDKEWANDPALLELRRQEIELRKAIAKSNNFDLEFEGDEEQ